MNTLSKTCQFMVTHLPHQRFVARLAFLCCLFVLTASCGAPSPSTPTLKIIERHGAPGTSQASCQGREQLVGGGYYAGRTSTNPVQASYPSDANTWSIVPAGIGATAFADCLVSSLAEPFVVQIVPGNSTPNLPEGSPVTAQASCKAGSIATGGGFVEVLTQKMIVETSAPTENRDGWMVLSHAHGVAGNTQPAIQAFAVCLSGPFKVLSADESRSDFALQPGSSKTNTVSCPQGYLLTSGGYMTTNPSSSQPLADTFATNTYPVDIPGSTPPSAPSSNVVNVWSLTAQNNSQNNTNGVVELVCIKHT